MLKSHYRKYTLHFKRPAGTSRGVYTRRDTWFIQIWNTDEPDITGIGECAPLPGLSSEYGPDFLKKLDEVCKMIDDIHQNFPEHVTAYPSIRFGLETALKDLQQKGSKVLLRNDFTEGARGIPVNGLIWMGSPDFMRSQIREKLEQGFNCIKLKIGALDFETELSMIKEIRKKFPSHEIEIRVDANGAFDPDNALDKLDRLASLRIHSIEQPVRAGLEEEMAKLCQVSPLPIALDEELIGINEKDEKQHLLELTEPQYIVLKPSLHGGMSGCEEWIRLAEARGIGWWVTSALESNIGLYAIAQWNSTWNPEIPQGLGTGQLFTNNIGSPLFIDRGKLWFDPEKKWDPVILG